MQTYAILQYLEDQQAWKIRFLGYDVYSTSWVTNAGLIHLWAGDITELRDHTKKVATFHNLKLIEPVSYELFQEIYEWIEAFLNGSELSPPISIFSLRFFPMYRKILEVPYGTVAHYSQLARSFPDRMKLIKALRYNPFPPLIPCHRIVSKNSFPGQYTPLGEKFKLQLIQKENRSKSVDNHTKRK
ncbi:MAG: methylated-DNA--[protein]-cysteine S-methyltransferase [Chlorobi bacterium]|nr:methylated-DNA--[protein]-cysteine S-methyltransferase [Chlorobiota bacterium]